MAAKGARKWGVCGHTFHNISYTFGHFSCEIGGCFFGIKKHDRHLARSQNDRSERGRHHTKGKLTCTAYTIRLCIHSEPFALWPPCWEHQLPFGHIRKSRAISGSPVGASCIDIHSLDYSRREARRREGPARYADEGASQYTAACNCNFFVVALEMF